MLNDLKVNSRINRVEDEYGIPHIYNSRGFRDSEWPDDLEHAVWCVGDSFTLGVSCPVEDTWPAMLGVKLNRRCINVSMSGASNVWLSRKAVDIINQVRPNLLIIQWSYFHRGEDSNSSLDDETRRIPYQHVELGDQLAQFDQCIASVESIKGKTKIIHCFIPGAITVYGPEYIQHKWDSIRGNIWDDTVDFDTLPEFIIQELKEFDLYDRFKLHHTYWPVLAKTLTDVVYIPMFEQLDYSADQHHYGKKTSAKFVELISNLI